MRYPANASLVRVALKRLLESEPKSRARRNPQPKWSELSYEERFAQVDAFRGAYAHLGKGRSMVEELSQERIREARRERREVVMDQAQQDMETLLGPLLSKSREELKRLIDEGKLDDLARIINGTDLLKAHAWFSQRTGH